MRDYKKLKCFELADSLVVLVYENVKNFPQHEVYGLTSQMRRAAVSIPANIVEGASRQTKKEFVQFLFIARGSAAELSYLLSLAEKLKYLSGEACSVLCKKCEEVEKTLHGLIRSVSADL